MKVMLATARPCYPLFLGGAEISMHETLLAFVRNGHTCRALGQATRGIDEVRAALEICPGRIRTQLVPTSDVCEALIDRCEIEFDVGYPAALTLHADFVGCLRRQLDEFQPDVVCSQLEGSELVVREAMRRRIPVVHTIRDLDNPHNFLPFQSRRTAGGDFRTLTTSRHMQRLLREQHGIKADIVPPAIDLERFGQNAAPHGGVVMVNPVPSKGGKIVRRLIAQMPDVMFVLVQGWSDLRADDWPFENVQLIRRRHDIECVIGGAAALLAPSQAEEAFGRVVVEAQAAGVPVLASRHSGLIEACGDGGGLIERYDEPGAWLANLREVLHNPERREALRQHGLGHAQQFSRVRHWDHLKAVWPR